MYDNNSYVYILVDKTKKKFKIGLTKNILQRYKTLNSIYGDFSLRDSYLIKCKRDYGKKLEKVLHFIFNDFNFNINSSLEGYTEWYKISSLKDVIELLQKIKKLNKNIIEIIKDIREIINESYLLKKGEKKEQINKIEYIKKKNIINTIWFLKTIKNLLKNRYLYKRDNFTLILEDISLTEVKKLSNNLFLTLFFEIGGINITESLEFKDKNLYIYFYFDSLNKYKNREELIKSYLLLEEFFKKYFNIKINKTKYCIKN